MANPEHVEIVKAGADAIERLGANYPIEGFDLRGADLEGVRFGAADLTRANFESADLFGAFFGAANLHAANFRNANLIGAHLELSNLQSADLRGAELSYANLTNAKVSDADFEGAQFYETILANIDLTGARGLHSVKHDGPSVIDERTLRKSWPLPDIFLRGCGLSDEQIGFSGATYGKAIDFYSCFISYSSKDREFAERLHNDLQTKGVRCWFAPEDLRIGDKFRTRIDEAIRLHDKLLLILSEASVNSTWVEDEVEGAFEKELQAKETGEERTVLFPIRLDSAVMETDAAWAASIRRTRHIGDFTAWKDHDAYQVAFQRLLRDLKSGATEGDNGES